MSKQVALYSQQPKTQDMKVQDFVSRTLPQAARITEDPASIDMKTALSATQVADQLLALNQNVTWSLIQQDQTTRSDFISLLENLNGFSLTGSTDGSINEWVNSHLTSLMDNICMSPLEPTYKSPESEAIEF